MGAERPSTVCCMNRQRLIVMAAAAVVALVAAGVASAAGGVGGPTQVDGSPAGSCWSKELERSKGAWPYRHRIFLYTVWCGSAGRISYRSSTVRAAHDTICWTETGPFLAKTAGGAGYSFVEVQAWAGVACHSALYFISFHDTLMMRVRYYPNGFYETVAYS
jgi:hypothetical protein